MWEDVAGAVGLAGKGAISGDRKQVPEPGPGAGGSGTAGGHWPGLQVRRKRGDLKVVRVTQGSPKAQCQWGQGRAPAAPGRLAQVRSLERLLLPGWGSPHSGPLSTAASSSCPRCTACHQRETRGTLQGRGPRPGAPALGAGPGPPGRHGSRQLPRPPRCLQQGPRVSPRALAHPPDTVGGSRRRRLPAGPDVEAAALSTGCAGPQSWRLALPPTVGTGGALF